MAKKRGGVGRRIKKEEHTIESDANAVCSRAEEEANEVVPIPNTCIDTVEDGPVKGDVRQVADYLRALQPELSRFISVIESHEQWSETMQLERAALIRQVVQTIRGHELSSLQSQRGSKFFNKFFSLLDYVLRSSLEDAGNTKEKEKITLESDGFHPKEVLSFLKRLITLYCDNVVDNITHMYGSHSAQSLLACFPAAALYEDKCLNVDVQGMTIIDLVSYFIGKIRDMNGFQYVIKHPCGTHVLRTLLLALLGFSVTQTSRLQVQDMQRKTRQGASSERLACTPHGLLIFKSLVSMIIQGVALQPLDYALNAYASPVLQLIVQLLQLREDQHQELRISIVSLYLPSSPAEMGHMKATLDQLLDSSCGSRFFELLLSSCSQKQMHTLIWFYLKKENVLNPCALSPYGNYVIQHIIMSSLLKPEEFKCLIDELDFEAILQAKRHGIIWKLASTCCRLKCHFKTVFTKYLEALKANSSTGFACLWYAIILNKTPKEVLGVEIKSDAPISSNFVVPGFAPDSIGCSILQTFLKFPKDSIKPLLQSVKAFTHKKYVSWLAALAAFREGSYLLQTLFDPYSALDVKIKDRLAKLLLPNIPKLAFHPTASFVVSFVFRGTSPDVREAIMESLQPLADDLNISNHSLYRSLDMKNYLKNQKAWTTGTTKVTKVQKLFEDILDPNHVPTAHKRKKDSQHCESQKTSSTSTVITNGNQSKKAKAH